MDYEVTWGEIEAECDGYRAGFVKTFKKYEGLATDKIGPNGRVIKVTQTSFAEHIGISRSQFGAWIKNNPSGRPADAPVGRQRTGHIGRQIAKSPTVSTDDKVGMLTDLLSDKKVLKQYREKRAPVTTDAEAKAAEAWADAITAPIAEGASHLQVPMWVDQLKKITKELETYEFDADEVRQLRKAVTKLSAEIEVQEFRLGLNQEVR